MLSSQPTYFWAPLVVLTYEINLNIILSISNENAFVIGDFNVRNKLTVEII